jgi:serine/threonine-protein kinase
MASDQDVQERLNAALIDRYHIESEIGSGGMATVYLAQDLKHDRRVAVKVLNPELAAVVGTERFLAEIRTTANLSHPHILPLHDSGEADGFLFYVMPYVKGESLRQRLDREGQLPVEEAVRIAGRVADALDHAHRQNVIHRDIKPANILFQDEEPVVADFGIALAVSAAGEGRLTETGLSLGTPYYMSPEQAAGEETPSAASDVYSLGCVLYEMLMGDPPHTGSSAQAILGKILLGEVTRPTKLRRTIPANVEGAILKALERLPADRFGSTAELAAALKDKAFRHGEGTAAVSGGMWKWTTLAATAVAVLLLGLVLRDALTPETLPPVMWHHIHPPGRETETSFYNYAGIAPDGSSMAYRDTVGLASGWQLWVKERGSVVGKPLPGTEGSRGQIEYSPDGQWVSYSLGQDLVKQHVQGTGREILLEGGRGNMGLTSWLDDGTILHDHGGAGLVRIPEDGGAPPDTILPTGTAIHWIHGLPGGEAALVVICPPVDCTAGGFLNVVDLQAKTAQQIMESVHRAWYLDSGYLVWVRGDGAVLATSFDLDRLEMGDRPTPLFEGVHRDDMVMSRDGTVYYVTGEVLPGNLRQVVWVDREGHFEAVDEGWPNDRFQTLALSPDGRELAVVIMEFSFEQVWVKELPGGALTRLTFDEARNRRAVWSLDQQTIAYVSRAGGDWHIRTVRSDGSSSGESEVLLESERGVFEISYTPDRGGAVVRLGTMSYGADTDLGYLDLNTGELDEALLATGFAERGAALSPDGRWLAYTSDQTGQREVFVRPFPAVGDRLVKVSTGGGSEPRWAHNGEELFFRDGEGWMTVASYSTEPTFAVESRDRLFDTEPYSAVPDYHAYDVALDDQRFLMARYAESSETTTPARLLMIQNFHTLIEERLVGR